MTEDDITTLVLTRRVGQIIDIADGIIEVEVAEISEGQARICIRAPRKILVDRHEVTERKRRTDFTVKLEKR